MALEKELAHYVARSVLEPINDDYLYLDLIIPIFTQGDGICQCERVSESP